MDRHFTKQNILSLLLIIQLGILLGIKWYEGFIDTRIERQKAQIASLFKSKNEALTKISSYRNTRPIQLYNINKIYWFLRGYSELNTYNFNKTKSGTAYVEIILKDRPMFIYELKNILKSLIKRFRRGILIENYAPPIKAKILLEFHNEMAQH